MRVAGRDRKPSAKAKSAGSGRKPLANGSQKAPNAADSAAVASTALAPSAAPPASSLASKRPASTGLASTSPAKKRAFTSPYHEFCQELRPLLPANLRNSEREKLLGLAWKALSGTEKRKFKATLNSDRCSGGVGGWHEGTRVAWAHVPAPQLQFAAPLAPQLQLAAPPAPQLQLITAPQQLQLAAPPAPQLDAPPAPQLKLMTAPQLQFTSAVILPPPAPAVAPVLWASRVLPIGMPVGVPVPLLDLPLPPLLPCMPGLSYPVAPPPALAVPSRAPELLTAAAAHRTFVELSLGDQEQLAELMEEQMTGEDAIEIAISLGMPH